ncbi:MAG: glycosyltransferase family 2 protein [Clostridia bacterium]|nr:glycosyltransferase family 2 protein [Clostridia bacterium]
MSKDKKISVALAAYKGEKFIEEQLDSILFQLKENDEIIVSDDLPGGETEQIVRAFAQKDARVKYIEGPRKGLIKNFENAIKNCTGDYIFLCDQDDVWLPDKVEQVTEKFDEGFSLVLHNAMVTDTSLKITDTSFFTSHGTKTGFLANILKNSYMGCCMAFKSELCGKILPFAEDIPMHDQWIGLIAEKSGKVCLIEKPLILYRRHGNNMTGGKTSLKQKIIWRISIVQKVLKRLSEK